MAQAKFGEMLLDAHPSFPSRSQQAGLSSPCSALHFNGGCAAAFGSSQLLPLLALTSCSSHSHNQREQEPTQKLLLCFPNPHQNLTIFKLTPIRWLVLQKTPSTFASIPKRTQSKAQIINTIGPKPIEFNVTHSNVESINYFLVF